MNKLKIAHDYFMKHGSPENFSTDIAEAWEYADRMIEQEQRREDKTRPEVLNMADSPELESHNNNGD